MTLVEGYWFAGGLIAGMIVASFLEWLVHVLMHRRWFLGKIHTQHHKDNTADGWFWEFSYYAAGAIPVGLVTTALGWYFAFFYLGLGFALGAVLHAAFAAYSHQIQHERPELVFWMSPPVHRVHHERQLWRSNFGISLDIWDRIFGTYERLEWHPDTSRTRQSWLDYIRIKWI